jgi:hypothetical protein
MGVGIAMGYGLDGPGSIRGSARFFSSQRRCRLWGPPSLLTNVYQGFFSREQSGRSVKLTVHLHLLPKSREVELYLHASTCLHGIVLNKLSTGTTLPFTNFKLCIKYRGNVLISWYYSKSEIPFQITALIFPESLQYIGFSWAHKTNHSFCNVNVSVSQFSMSFYTWMELWITQFSPSKALVSPCVRVKQNCAFSSLRWAYCSDN